MSTPHKAVAVLILLLGAALAAGAQENYFVTYTHQMEEPGNLEVGLKTASGWPKAAKSFVGSSMELEYGVKAWWTTELYLDGQATPGANATFSGFRWENRFRPLLTEHWINPVLYAEFEDINAGNRSLLEVVGHDGVEDILARPERAEKERELELKLILSSNARGWNFAENFIAEKNFAAGEPWEFGYAVGVSRALSLRASPNPCTFCRENFALGAEMYGGLGDTEGFGLANTSHYIAPTVKWNVPGGPSFRFSPGFGLNDHSSGFLLRVGVTYEFEQIFARKK